MKAMCAGLMLSFVVAATGVPAAADLVEVTTAVTMPAQATEEDFRKAVGVAAQEVLDNVDPLQPVMMVITAAYLSAGRLYVRFLVADEAGARQLGVRRADPESPEPGTIERIDDLRI
jgi:hypothetical protein